MKKVVEVKNLSKNYGKLKAVDRISFYVEKGEIFGLLGENGAGKTTTLEIIEGLRRKSGGEIRVLGHRVDGKLKDIKEKIGVQLQASAYYKFLNLTEILELLGSFYQNSVKVEPLLKIVGLEKKKKSYISNLSGGQRQRFSIIASLINDPEIVFLDEPTTGLDPLARRNLWKIIAKIKSQGKTIILTTHYMEEAETLCDRIAIMEKGKIVSMGEVHQLVEKVKYPYKINFTAKKMAKKIFLQLSKIGQAKNITNSKFYNFEVRLSRKSDLSRTMKIIEKVKPESFTVCRATLEDLFIELTGKTISDEEEVSA